MPAFEEKKLIHIIFRNSKAGEEGGRSSSPNSIGLSIQQSDDDIWSLIKKCGPYRLGLHIRLQIPMSVRPSDCNLCLSCDVFCLTSYS